MSLLVLQPKHHLGLFSFPVMQIYSPLFAVEELRSCATLNRILRQTQPPEVFYKKGVLNNSVKLTGKQLYMTLFFDKVSDLTPKNLLKKIFQHRCLPVRLAQVVNLQY